MRLVAALIIFTFAFCAWVATAAWKERHRPLANIHPACLPKGPPLLKRDRLENNIVKPSEDWGIA